MSMSDRKPSENQKPPRGDRKNDASKSGTTDNRSVEHGKFGGNQRKY